MNLESLQRNLALVGLLSLSMAGCGGGGGGSATNDAASSPGITITGTAATGLAIPNGQVDAKCMVGAGATTSKIDGTFSLVVSGGAFPCVLQITNPINGLKLRTVSVGTGNAAVANITPLTEMLAARALGNDPAAFFAAFNSTVAASKITATNLASAQTDVREILEGTQDTTSVVDFVTTALKAATSSNPSGGDAQDKVLDALGTKIDDAKLKQIVPVIANTPNTTDVKRVLANVTSGKGIRPSIGWEVSVTPKIFTYVMQLCYGSQCRPMGGSILMKVDSNDPLLVVGTANGITFDDLTRDELQQIIDAGTVALNNVIGNVWNGATTPGATTIENVFNTALANATSPEDVVARVKSLFAASGFPAAAGIPAGSGEAPGVALGGYQCPTTKTVNDPDWLQSHGSYWAAASAHDAYTACLANGSSASCEGFYTQETQLCSYAKPACLAVATSASSCPG